VYLDADYGDAGLRIDGGPAYVQGRRFAPVVAR